MPCKCIFCHACYTARQLHLKQRRFFSRRNCEGIRSNACNAIWHCKLLIVLFVWISYQMSHLRYTGRHPVHNNVYSPDQHKSVPKSTAERKAAGSICRMDAPISKYLIPSWIASAYIISKLIRNVEVPLVVVVRNQFRYLPPISRSWIVFIPIVITIQLIPIDKIIPQLVGIPQVNIQIFLWHNTWKCNLICPFCITKPANTVTVFNSHAINPRFNQRIASCTRLYHIISPIRVVNAQRIDWCINRNTRRLRHAPRRLILWTVNGSFTVEVVIREENKRLVRKNIYGFQIRTSRQRIIAKAPNCPWNCHFRQRRTVREHIVIDSQQRFRKCDVLQ